MDITGRRYYHHPYRTYMCKLPLPKGIYSFKVLLKNVKNLFSLSSIFVVIKGMCFVLRYFCFSSIISHLTLEAHKTTPGSLWYSNVYLAHEPLSSLKFSNPLPSSLLLQICILLANEHLWSTHIWYNGLSTVLYQMYSTFIFLVWFCYSPDIVGLYYTIRVWVRHVARIGLRRNAQRFWWRIPKKVDRCEDPGTYGSIVQ
jgi:hypothetical protein